MSNIPPIIRFAGVGVLGFVVDAATLLAMLQFLPEGVARFVAFCVAVTFTYMANRWFTFDAKGQPGFIRSYVKFIIANSGGGLVNLVVSTTALKLDGPLISHPVIAVGLGSIAGMLINYTLSRRFVFARQPKAD